MSNFSSFSNTLFSLSDLFEKSLFRIPDYQRGYSWRTLQLEVTWSDILNLLPEREHYTGMIVLKELDKEYTNKDKWREERWLLNKEDYKVYHVVDGQQRLTTFIILIKEIISFYEKANKKFINKISLDEYKKIFLVCTDSDSPNINNTFKFGYEEDNPSYEFFKDIIIGDSKSVDLEETFYTLNLENAKKFFADKLQELNDLKVIEDIFIKVTQRLKFNIYLVGNDENSENVFVSFETMNNRGKKLSNLELLKNRLIYLSTLFETEEEYTRKNVRANINDVWKDIYIYLGKNRKPLNDEEFLRDHWIIYFGYTRSKGITYSSFLLNDYFIQNNISEENIKKIIEESESDDYYNENEDIDLDEFENTEEDVIIPENKKEKLTLSIINKYIDSIKTLIPYWYVIQNPDDKFINIPNSIREMLKKLNRLQFAYFKPLITVLLSKKNISDEKKEECLNKIERYIFLYFRLGSYQSTYKNSFFWNYAHKLFNDEIGIDSVIEEVNNIEYLSEDNKVTSMASIYNKFDRLFRKADGYYSWPTLKYFLYEYELHFENVNKKIDPELLFKKDEKDKISIEHIYPQKDTDKYWRKYFGNYRDSDKKRLKGSLGNLLLLSSSINAELQNKSYEVKRKRYKDGSGSCSAQDVAHKNNWRPEEIEERGKKLINFMQNRYDFKITRNQKIKMLGLEFMKNKESDQSVDQLKNSIHSSKSKNRKKKKSR